jgi:hypothetical protein
LGLICLRLSLAVDRTQVVYSQISNLYSVFCPAAEGACLRLRLANLSAFQTSFKLSSKSLVCLCCWLVLCVTMNIYFFHMCRFWLLLCTSCAREALRILQLLRNSLDVSKCSKRLAKNSSREATDVFINIMWTLVLQNPSVQHRYGC